MKKVLNKKIVKKLVKKAIKRSSKKGTLKLNDVNSSALTKDIVPIIAKASQEISVTEKFCKERGISLKSLEPNPKAKFKPSIVERRFTNSIKIYCLTDVHIGHCNHDEDKFNKTIEEILADPNAYCFFNGDTCEMKPKGSPHLQYKEQIMSLNEQYDVFKNLLKKLGNKVLFFKDGNHEDGVYKASDFSVFETLDDLGIPKAPIGMSLLNIFINERKFSIVSTHGLGGNSNMVFNNMVCTYPLADIYFMGHTHQFHMDSSWTCTEEIPGTGIYRQKRRYQLIGGSYLLNPTYQADTNQKTKVTGCFVLTFTEKGMSYSEFVDV